MQECNLGSFIIWRWWSFLIENFFQTAGSKAFFITLTIYEYATLIESHLCLLSLYLQSGASLLVASKSYTPDLLKFR